MKKRKKNIGIVRVLLKQMKLNVIILIMVINYIVLLLEMPFLKIVLYFMKRNLIIQLV